MNKRTQLVLVLFTSAFLVSPLSGFMAASAQPVLAPVKPRLAVPVKPAIELPIAPGNVTLDVVEHWNVIETRRKNGRRGIVACRGLPQSGQAPLTLFDELTEDQLGVGYLNDRTNERKRCRDAISSTHHAIATYNAQPVYDGARAQFPNAESVVNVRIKTVTVRLEQKRTSHEPHRRCFLGPAPLAQIRIQQSARSLPKGPAPDFHAFFDEGEYTTVDGRSVGFGERFRALPPQGGFPEINHHEDGSATIFWTANEDAIEQMNAHNIVPDTVLLISAENTEFNSRKSCFAAHENIRLVMTYEAAPAE